MFLRRNKELSHMTNEIKGYMKKYGFQTAAELTDFSKMNKFQLNNIIDSWKSYPKSFGIYPNVLTKKIYNEETTLYVRA
jgi:hypothetical protein